MYEWTDFLDSGGQIDVIYTDFAKAFDKVPHQRLLAKLKSYVFAGVMQGGVLSPILFSIFIDSVICKLRASGHGASILVHTILAPLLLYADDIMLVSHSVYVMQPMLDICSEEAVLCGMPTIQYSAKKRF